MKIRFSEYYKNKLELSEDQRIVLTVSGGVDSMVMLDLFRVSKLKFVVAHCNFHLRGNESDRDMNHVQKYCNLYNIEIFIQHFDTKDYAKKHGVSIQMAARDLRYQWFDEMRKNIGFEYIATAHHLDDQAETFLINLIRGTGIAGLHGIAPKKKFIIRPLMFCSRAEILEYALKNNIPFVEDSSNYSDKYLRNNVRHNIIPLFKSQNSNFISNLANTIVKLADIEQAFKSQTNIIFNSMLEIHNDKITISISKLLEINNLRPYLSEFLTQYGFNESCIENIYQNLLSDKSGLRFFSESYRLIKDRKTLIITPYLTGDQSSSNDFFIINEDFNDLIPIELSFKRSNEKPIINPKKNIAYFDFQKLNFPLALRRWTNGDFFYPYGMKGKKLVSDFFTDEKLSIDEKENIWILCSGKDIIWIIGHRSDDRFKLSNNTTDFLTIEYGNY
ncbi:MAG: tRNA lysidine(34) synthetase TilS [Bacteroidetes bacterium CG2_30_33_31]|nr:MAG: tRNA lysidine(34) synthetase TilS [Bacteroidetes bacterium CG2_30_33_31]